MKNIISIIIIVLNLVSCINEPFDNSFFNGEQLEMKLNINTRTSATTAENHIETVRIIVVKENGSKVFSKIVTPNIAGENLLEYQLTIVAGTYKFIVVCNESSELTTKLNAATTLSEIENATFEVKNLLEPSFVMYGSVNATVKKIDETVKVDYGMGYQDRLVVDMKRIAAKGSISLIKNSSTINKITNLNVSIVQRPAFNLLGENIDYRGVNWLANQRLQISSNSLYALNDNATYQIINSENGFSKFDINGEYITIDDFYIPENVLTNPNENNRNTYIEISADCELTGGIIIPAKWRIDFINQGNYGVKRNHHYNILGTIKDVGAMDLYAEVVPVTEVDIEIGWGLIEGLTIVSDRTDKYGHNEDVWNNFDKLTGILKGYTPASETESEKYQDVVFKYGSVLAIKSDNNPYSSSKILWNPPDFMKPTNYADIQFTSSGNINAGQINGTNSATNINKGIGDPCRLVRLSNRQIQAGIVDNYQWRMMTEEEMGRLITANDIQDPTVDYIDTKGYYAYHSWLIPKTIARDALTGNPVTGANNGFYWTSEGAKAFIFTAGNQELGAQSIVMANPSKAGTIRCIRTTVPEKIKSVMSYNMNNSNITYQGGVKELEVLTNIPYWTAKLTDLSVTERKTGVPISPLPSFENFSFLSGNTNILATTGMNSTTLNAYIKRYESNTHNSTYTITLTGFGYDGQTLIRTITINQVPFDWEARVIGILGATGPIINGTQSIRQGGESISAQVRIAPSDVLLPTDVIIGLKVDSYFTTNIISGSNNTIPNLLVSNPEINNLDSQSNRLIWLNDVVVDANIAPNPRSIFVTPTLYGLPYVTNVRISILQEAN